MRGGNDEHDGGHHCAIYATCLWGRVSEKRAMWNGLLVLTYMTNRQRARAYLEVLVDAVIDDGVCACRTCRHKTANPCS